MILVNSGLIKIPALDFETVAYHFFKISFISIGSRAVVKLKETHRCEGEV